MFTDINYETAPVVKADFQLSSFFVQLISIIKGGHNCCRSIVVTNIIGMQAT